MDGCSPIAAATQSTALYLEIAVGSSPSSAPAQALSTIIKTLAAASAKGDATWQRGALVFQVARVRFNAAGTRAILLLRHKEDEAAALASTHMVIDLAPSAGAYAAILETASGLTVAQLEQGIQGLTRRLCEFYFQSGRGRFRQARPHVTIADCGVVVAFALERGYSSREATIRADVSVKLDALLRRRARVVTT